MCYNQLPSNHHGLMSLASFAGASVLISVLSVQAALPVIWFLPSIMWIVRRLFPGKGIAMIIPSTYLRFLTFKLTADLRAVRFPPTMEQLLLACTLACLEAT